MLKPQSPRQVLSLATALLFLGVGQAWSQEPGTATLPDSLMAAGTKVVWVKKLPYYCEGPAVDKDGSLFFDQQMSNNTPEWPIWKINPAIPTDTGSIFLQNSSQANGINFDKEWRMVVCQNKKISRIDNKGVATELTTSGNGATFGQANDMGISSTGSMYFTDLGKNVYFMDEQGKVKTVYTNANSANGIEWIEEKSEVYLNQSTGTTRFHATTDGTLTNPVPIFAVNGTDGLCLDEHGNFYIASYSEGTLYAFNNAGVKLGSIVMNATGIYDARPGKQGNTDNCAFGGPENKTMFITGDGGVYSVKMKIAGRRIPGMATGLILKPAPRGWSLPTHFFRLDGRTVSKGFWLPKK
jgi:gluconolactonase